MPNKALVSAMIRNIRKTEDTDIVLVDLEILSSETVPGYSDFVSRFVGGTVEAKLLLKNRVEAKLLLKNRVEAKLLLKNRVENRKPVRLIVEYRGDEHSGSFYAEES